MIDSGFISSFNFRYIYYLLLLPAKYQFISLLLPFQDLLKHFDKLNKTFNKDLIKYKNDITDEI